MDPWGKPANALKPGNAIHVIHNNSVFKVASKHDVLYLSLNTTSYEDPYYMDSNGVLFWTGLLLSLLQIPCIRDIVNDRALCNTCSLIDAAIVRETSNIHEVMHRSLRQGQK